MKTTLNDQLAAPCSAAFLAAARVAVRAAAWDVQREKFIRMIGCIESGVMYEIGGDK